MTTPETPTAARPASFRSLVAAVCVTSACAGLIAADADAASPNTPVPPGYSTSRTGGIHDFDYFVGGWTTVQHRLRVRREGTKVWDTFPATVCLTTYLDGLATVDEMYMPTKGKAGLTLRTFDIQKRQWSIYWVSSADGTLGYPGVVGGFRGAHGEFYGDDEDNGRPFRVRYTWDELDRDHARWEQAFSYDNRTWQTNWIGDFARGDAAKLCKNNRPRR